MAYHTFTLSWPSKDLWSNGGRANRFAYSRAAKAQKNEAWKAALASGIRKEERAHVFVTWHPNAKGPLPDDDNCEASFKHARDGIAAALGIDDRHIPFQHKISTERRGCIVVNVSTGDSADVPLKGAIS
jgi:hypothetical protein